LRLIESGMQLNESQWLPIRDYLLRSGEIKAWFLYYQGANQWTKRFYDKQWFFLLEKELLSVGLYADGNIELTSYKPDEFARIVRSFGYADKERTKMVLAQVSILLKHSSLKNRPESLDFKRPSELDQGDPEGYERLMNLL